MISRLGTEDKKLNLSHAESEQAFSEWWGLRYYDPKEYPEWIELCHQLAKEVESNSGNYYSKLIATLLMKAGFDDVSGCNLHREQACACRYKEYKQNDERKKYVDNLIKELSIWNLNSIRKLVLDVLRYYAVNDCDLEDTVKDLREKFIEPLITFINEINACRPRKTSTYNISRESSEYKRFDENLKCSDIADIIREREETRREQLLAHSAAAAQAAANQSALHLDVDDLALPSAPAKQTLAEKPALSSTWETLLLMALGAVAALLIVTVVVVATHGAALPFFAGIGTAVLLSHGSAAAGLGVGLSLLGAASASIGAACGFVAKKAENMLKWFFKSKDQPDAARFSTAAIMNSGHANNNQQQQPANAASGVVNYGSMLRPAANSGSAKKQTSCWASLFSCCTPNDGRRPQPEETQAPGLSRLS